MVSLAMDDLSSCNLALPIGPTSPTPNWRRPMASVAVAAAAAPVVVVAIAVVALSTACLHLVQNGQRPMSLGRDYRKSDR